MPRVVVVLPLATLEVGESFPVDEWPLHITVAAPFQTDAEPAELAAIIHRVAVGHPALTARVGPDAMFGRRHDVPVSLIEDAPALTNLHRALKAALRQVAATPEEHAFRSDEFRAHVTAKHHDRVHEGDLLHLTSIALVDMAPRTAPGRTVLATCNLLAPPDV